MDPKIRKKSKRAREYNAKSVELDGINFHSQTEADFYIELKKDENIKLIELQPQYQIMQPYKVVCKRCRGERKVASVKTGKPVNCGYCSGSGFKERQGGVYTADFKLTYMDGYTEVIDVKGYMSERDFPLRKKLFEIKTGVELIVVRYDRENKQWKRS